jgi:hypothetical protein
VNTVTETCTQSEDRWDVGVHAPIWWSNPRSGDGRSPEDVYDLNSAKVRDCAGMIVLALGGGSTGVGQELAWAFQLRLPVLYLYPSYGHVSRQIEGSPGDKTVTAFADTSELVDAVRAFLLANRSVIADHARRAKGEATKFAPLRADLLARWHSLTQPDQKRVAGEARLPVRRVEELLGDDTSLGSASLSELAALIGSVWSSFQALAPTQALPELQDRQHDALAQCSDEYEWPGSKALRLEQAARLELARGGLRRLSLETPADWLRFDKYCQKNARRR